MNQPNQKKSAGIFLVSGSPGSGKSTLSKAIAKSQKKSIYIECDLLYNMVVAGYKYPWEDKNRFLLHLMYQTAAAQAEFYLSAGFCVVIDYVWERDDLEFFLSQFQKKSYRIQPIFLLPNLKVNILRDRKRKWSVGKQRIAHYHRNFEKLKSKFPVIFVDNSQKTSSQFPIETPIYSIFSFLKTLKDSK